MSNAKKVAEEINENIEDSSSSLRDKISKIGSRLDNSLENGKEWAVEAEKQARTTLKSSPFISVGIAALVGAAAYGIFGRLLDRK